MMLVEKSFHAGEAVLNYAEGPDAGPPLLCLHGLTDRWQYFLPILPALSMRWHTHALDFRGHGRSSRTPPYRYRDHISDTIAFLEDRVRKETVLFGSSMGGMISLMVAAKRPDLVRAVIFGDASIKVRHVREVMADYHSYWEGWRELAGFEGPIGDLIKAVADMPVDVPGQGKSRYGEGLDLTALLNKANYLRHLDPDVLTDWARGADDAEAYENVTQGYDEGLLAEISCPVIILQGNVEKGAIMSDEEVEYALSLIPGAHHVYLEEYGHNLGLYSWDVSHLLQVVNTFLESLL
jgi:pimeloyl-ACP methyl ester carboxylesterase